MYARHRMEGTVVLWVDLLGGSNQYQDQQQRLWLRSSVAPSLAGGHSLRCARSMVDR